MTKCFVRPKRKIYIIGVLKNEQVPILGNKLREIFGKEVEVFEEWYYSSPDADHWLHQECKNRGLSYKQALQTYAAKNTFNFDKRHLDEATDVIMLMPAGKSGHLELGYCSNPLANKRTYVFFQEGWPEKIDIMYQFATGIFADFNELITELKKYE